MRTRLLFLLVLLFLSVSCELINPEEQIPAYVYIESFDYQSKPGEGTDQVEILDAWLFVDNNSLGVYNLPATIPILAEGKTFISAAPGIMLYRIRNNRTNNPFYKTANFDIDLAPGRVDTLKPVTGFGNRGEIVWNEDFENPGFSLDSSDFSRSDFFKVSDPTIVFEGTQCIGFKMDQDKFKFVGQSSRTSPFKRPARGGPVFLELHYKNTNSFSIDLKVQRASGAIQDFPNLTLRPSGEWKKVYVNFTPFTNPLEDGAVFWILFRSELDEGASQGEVYLDNIKLMY